MSAQAAQCLKATGTPLPPALCPPAHDQTQSRERGAKQEHEQIRLTNLKREQENRERDKTDKYEGRTKTRSHPKIKGLPAWVRGGEPLQLLSTDQGMDLLVQVKG